jgi:uncharacterized coiled-coil DUF342 family protein
MQALTDEIQRLRQENAKLANELNQLRQENDKLTNRMASLLELLQQLRDELVILKRDKRPRNFL